MSGYTASIVAFEPPIIDASTLPDLSMTTTPLWVPLDAFPKPSELMSSPLWSQIKVYGKLCLGLKLILAFMESCESP